MKKLSQSILALGCVATLALAGCASSSPSMPKASGFLPDYSLLKPVANPPAGTQIYTYTNPAVQQGEYTAVMVAPVILYQTATENGVNNAEIENARLNIQNGVKQMVSQKLPVVNQAGPGVAKLTVAITGAQLQGSGFEPWNLIPISAAIKLTTMATGTDNKKPVLVVELKFVDSNSGQLLREIVSTISGDNFRNQANTAQEFQQLAQTWVQQALNYSSAQNS